MAYRLLADAVLVAHLAFITFVVAGGFVAIRWPRLAWIHVPCAAWGVIVEWMGWVCPLTPLENHFRRLAGEGGYRGSFVEHYLVPLIYPEAVERDLQLALGLFVLVLNAVAYAFVIRRVRRRI